MPRSGPTALLVVLLCCAPPAGASTFLHLRGEEGDAMGALALPYRWLDESNATVSAYQQFPGTFGFTFLLGSGESWTVFWTDAFGGAFAPGTYDVLNYVQVTTGGFFCSISGTHVIVHDVVLDGATVKTAAFDFEQHCDGSTQGGLFGSLRYRSGDLECDGTEDGAPCEDRDQCTPAASCLVGRCIPDDARPSCPSDTICTVAAPCDPASGTCLASPAAPWGEACDDGNACTLAGHCEGTGACVGEPLDCDDESPCTTDSCDAASGCVHAPVAEQCWSIASRSIAHVTASGTIRGRHVRCAGTCASGSLQLLLIDGDRYRIPSGTTQCTNGEPFEGTDETGTLVPARRGRTAFSIENLDQLQDDLLFCTGARLKGIKRVMSLAPGGSTLTGLERVRTKLPEQIPTRLAIKSTFNGAPFEVGEPPDFPDFPPGRRPPDCGSGLRVHCKVD